MIVKQRKHIRLLPSENTFAVIGQKSTKTGKVKNISLGGLTIEYIAGKERNHKHKPTLVDIFMTENVFYIYIRNIFIHKWRKWVQYEVYIPERRITKNWGLSSVKEYRQAKSCKKCEKVKDELIRAEVIN